MLTFQQARKIAEDKVKSMRSTEKLVIADDDTIERPYAWIFCYTSSLFIETGDILNALAGNAPLFISKTDGEVSTYRTGLSMAGMIEQYEEENNIWELMLAEHIYSDPKKLSTLKKILGFDTARIAEYVANKELLLDSGSEKRLLHIQTRLNASGIRAVLSLRAME